MKLNERHIQFLFLVATFGHLTNRDAARLCLAGMNGNVALVTAQNTGRRLAEEGLLLIKTLPLDHLSKVYILTAAGAQALNDHHIEPWLEMDDKGDGRQWFADGYNLSFGDNVTRRPMLELLQQLSSQHGWLPVGQRGLKRNVFGLARLGHFDAVLVDPQTFTPMRAVYLAHPSTNTSTRHVCKLAQAGWQFAVAAHGGPQLEALRRWRAKVNPSLDGWVRERLPAGVVA